MRWDLWAHIKPHYIFTDLSPVTIYKNSPHLAERKLIDLIRRTTIIRDIERNGDALRGTGPDRRRGGRASRNPNLTAVQPLRERNWAKWRRAGRIIGERKRQDTHRGAFSHFLSCAVRRRGVQGFVRVDILSLMPP